MSTPVPSAHAIEDSLPPIPDGVVDPPAPVKGLRRLMAWIVPGNIGIFLLWGAIPGILLPQQVTVLFGDENKVANLAIVTTIGAFVAMLAQPIAGQISDRTRSRFGRRAPWMVAGVLAGALALVGLAFANSLVGVVIAWTIVQLCYNFAQGPLSAVMPDRVPVRRRGGFATLVGIGTMGGALGGQILASMFFENLTAGYLVFAAISVVGIFSFVLANPDHPSVDLETDPFRFSDFLRTFWVNPVRHPDFFWAFTGRLLLYTGFFGVTGFQLFLLTDYFGVDNPTTVIPAAGLLNLAGIIIATVVSGPLSDRVGRRKPFVFGSSIVTGAALVLPWLWADVTAWMIMMFIAGLGFGMFQAVDTALMSEVLPSAKSFAKDLGVVNIAATIPQTLAPGIAGLVVIAFGYGALFPVGILLSVLGACAVWPIKAVR